tara:strand:+ start:306 stop:668 length:363 start_codon:yes stop_codon:yes gene_type:complete
MSTVNPKYVYYIERNRLFLAEDKGDGVYQNIPAGSKVRIYGTKQADHFAMDNELLLDIPAQFHEAIVYRAIANGYETPPNLDPKAGVYFRDIYNKLVRKAKQWKTRGRQGNFGNIIPRDF